MSRGGPARDERRAAAGTRHRLADAGRTRRAAPRAGDPRRRSSWQTHRVRTARPPFGARNLTGGRANRRACPWAAMTTPGRSSIGHPDRPCGGLLSLDTIAATEGRPNERHVSLEAPTRTANGGLSTRANACSRPTTVLAGNRAPVACAARVERPEPLRRIASPSRPVEKDAVLHVRAIPAVILRRRFPTDGVALMHNENSAAVSLPVLRGSQRLPVLGRVDTSHLAAPILAFRIDPRMSAARSVTRSCVAGSLRLRARLYRATGGFRGAYWRAARRIRAITARRYR